MSMSLFWQNKTPWGDFEGLTTDSYFGKTRPPGERLDRKKAF